MIEEVASAPKEALSEEKITSQPTELAAADGESNGDNKGGGGGGRGSRGRGGRGGRGGKGEANRGRSNNKTNKQDGDNAETEAPKSTADADGNASGDDTKPTKKEGGGSPRRRRRNNNNNRNRKIGNKESEDKGSDETAAVAKENGDAAETKESDTAAKGNTDKRNNNRNRNRNNNSSNNKNKGKAANVDDLMKELAEFKTKLKESERMEALYKKRYSQLNTKWKDIKGVNFEDCIVVAVPKTTEGASEATTPTTDAEKIPVLEQHIANLEQELGNTKTELHSTTQKLEQAEKYAATNKDRFSKLNEKWRLLKEGEKKDSDGKIKEAKEEEIVGEITEEDKPAEQEETIVEKKEEDKPAEQEEKMGETKEEENPAEQEEAVGENTEEEKPAEQEESIGEKTEEEKPAEQEAAVAQDSTDGEETMEA